REAADGKNREVARSDRFTHPLDIAETSLRSGWGYTKYHHSSRFACCIECGSHNLPELLRLLDVMVSWEHRHQRVAPRHMAHMNGRQADCHRSIHSHGLDQHALASSCGNLFADGRGLLRIRDRPDAFGGNQRLQTRGGLLQHGVLAEDVQQLLWCACAAPRPKACAAAPGK